MKSLFRAPVYALLLAAVLTPHASADLLSNGNLTGIIDTTNAGNTFGQFGSDSANPAIASGAVLTVPGWDTSGYNFVYTPGTADQGTKASGANSSLPHQEAPGEYNVKGASYGSTYLWGAGNNSPAATTPDPFSSPNLPFAGNFIASDAVFQTGAISTAITGGLRTGQAYTLTFYWAVAQQESYSGANQGNDWQVTLTPGTGSAQVFTTPSKDLASQAFSGWMRSTTTFTYTGTSTTATLSFLAQQVVPNGGTGGNPPFLVLGGVSLVPEPSSGTLLALVGAGLAAGWCVRRRRLAGADAQG